MVCDLCCRRCCVAGPAPLNPTVVVLRGTRECSSVGRRRRVERGTSAFIYDAACPRNLGLPIWKIEDNVA